MSRYLTTILVPDSFKTIMTCFDPRILVLGSGVLIPMSDLTLLLKNEVFSGMCGRDCHEDAARNSMFVLKSDVTSLPPNSERMS